jgi:hypothetical protein
MSTPMLTVFVADKCRKCREIDQSFRKVKECLTALNDNVQWRIKGLRGAEEGATLNNGSGGAGYGSSLLSPRHLGSLEFGMGRMGGIGRLL